MHHSSTTFPWTARGSDRRRAISPGAVMLVVGTLAVLIFTAVFFVVARPRRPPPEISRQVRSAHFQSSALDPTRPTGRPFRPGSPAPGPNPVPASESRPR